MRTAISTQSGTGTVFETWREAFEHFQSVASELDLKVGSMYITAGSDDDEYVVAGCYLPTPVAPDHPEAPL
jgi:hypothetical protein